MFEPLNLEPLPCPEDINCGAGKCLIDPLFPKKPVCVCNPDTVKTKDGKCECEYFYFLN